MAHEEIEVVLTDGSIIKHIVLDLGDGAFQSFPADPENPEYAAYLESLEAPAPKAK